MKNTLLAAVVILGLAGVASAEHFFANITAADHVKNTIVFKVTSGKQKGNEIKATLIRECVIREGSYRLGKPAQLKEGDPLVNGLRNFAFQNVSAERPVR